MKKNEFLILRKLIKNIIKENYDSVPTTPGLYTSYNKHVEGNIWKLLNCYDKAKNLINQQNWTEKQKDIILNKIVFGNYGPKYGYNSGIYYGGYDWNNESDIEDKNIPSDQAVTIVDQIIEALNVNNEYQKLRLNYSGKEKYDKIAYDYSYKNPEKIAYNQKNPKQQISHNKTIGKHCLGTFLSPFGQKEYEEFYSYTGLEPIQDAAGKHEIICLILFFNNNEPTYYYSFPYQNNEHIDSIIRNWIKFEKLPQDFPLKNLYNYQVNKFINLNNLKNDKMTFINGGEYFESDLSNSIGINSKRFWSMGQNPKQAQTISYK